MGRRRKRIDPEASLRAMDARMGKRRAKEYPNGNGSAIAAGEEVRVKGIGTGNRKLVFCDYVQGPDYEYVTLLDPKSQASRFVRPSQISKCRKQRKAVEGRHHE